MLYVYLRQILFVKFLMITTHDYYIGRNKIEFIV